MATANPKGPCVFCGKPAHLTVLVTLRVRAKPLPPTRIRICRICRRTELGDVPDATDKASNQPPSPPPRSTTR